jgi:chromosome segregation ATPase
MKKRKEIAKKLILDSGLSMAKIADKLGMNNRQTLIYHFNKEDIDLDLFVSILKLFNKNYQEYEADIGDTNYVVKENPVLYNSPYDRIKSLEKENTELKARCFDLHTEVEALKLEVERLRVQSITLLQAHSESEKMKKS